MFWASRQFGAVWVMLLGLGLIFTQLCNTVCALAGCDTPPPVASAQTTRQSAPDQPPGHCHQRQTLPEAPQPGAPTDPAPQPPPHSCPSHVFAVSLAPLDVKANELVQQQLLPFLAESVWLTPCSLSYAANTAADGLASHSPPRQPLRSILRI